MHLCVSADTIPQEQLGGQNDNLCSASGLFHRGTREKYPIIKYPKNMDPFRRYSASGRHKYPTIKCPKPSDQYCDIYLICDFTNIWLTLPRVQTNSFGRSDPVTDARRAGGGRTVRHDGFRSCVETGNSRCCYNSSASTTHQQDGESVLY